MGGILFGFVIGLWKSLDRGGVAIVPGRRETDLEPASEYSLCVGDSARTVGAKTRSLRIGVDLDERALPKSLHMSTWLSGRSR